MSVSNIKLLATTELVNDPIPLYKTRFKPTQIVTRSNGTIWDSGGVDTIIEDTFTESTFNLTVQQACADAANNDTENIEAFVASDVYGGRI